MMNVRIKLREPNGPVVPEGPSFAWSRTFKTTIDGTKIQFMVPKHRPRRPHKPTLPDKSYRSDRIAFYESRNERLSVPFDWRYWKLFDHSWAFYGPWFTGIRAELGMDITLLKPVNYANPDISLFHPRAFEQMLGDYLTYLHAGSTSRTKGGKCYSIGPVDWHPYTKLPTVAARLNVISDETVQPASRQHFLFFPISNQLMVSVLFFPYQVLYHELLVPPTQDEFDRHVSPTTMFALIDQIIDSFQVELSPEALAQQQAALAGLEDTSLVSEYPPLDWNSPEFRKHAFKQDETSDN